VGKVQRLPAPEWLNDVAEKDYIAAYSYLSLKLDVWRAGVVVDRLRAAEVTTRRANDILRACDYKALPLDDPGVHREWQKLAHEGTKLSPILVVSFTMGGDIADGYHRLSYTYNVSPYADVPLRIAEL
jgi:hypothetical protein